MPRMTERARLTMTAGGGRGSEPRVAGAMRGLVLAVVAFVILAGALAGSALAATPPKVTKSPLSITVEEGQPATFTATAGGTPTPTAQWEVSSNGGTSFSAVPGATTATLTIAAVLEAENGYQYRVTFKNTAGEATSKAATLTVQRLPALTLQPIGTTVEEGQTATFEATASGLPAPTVQWQTSPNGTSWSNISGGTSDQLVIVDAQSSINGHEYRAVFTNAAGKATSQAARLTVQKVPTIEKQPASANVEVGHSVSFEATAGGFPAPTVSWEVSIDGGSTWTTVEGATADRLTIEGVTSEESGYEYRAIFSNIAGTATSSSATLTVVAPPVITQEPVGALVQQGGEAVFEASATGSPTPTVQWQVSTNSGGSWSAIAGANSNTLSLADVEAVLSGHEYRAVFTNSVGSATTTVARLTVSTSRFEALAWGDNLERQLGSGSSEAFSDLPLSAGGLDFVTAVSAGGVHSLALLANGTVMAWGDNEHGQLGDEEVEISNTPVTVSGLSGVVAIAAGGDHSLALLENGTVMAWGDNEDGQLGDGNTVESRVPVTVKGLTGVKAIAAGADHSLALLDNGTVMAWGDNEDGQLGNGTTVDRSVPVAVKGLSGVSAISAGGEFSLALLSTGTVEGWGSDAYGQLGTAVPKEEEERLSDVPVSLSGLSGVTSVAAGAKHALALLGNGTVMAWGEDSYGELGNGTITAIEETPVAVSGLSGVASISAGGMDSAAVLASGPAWTWGINRWGTLGDGTAGSPSDVPVRVSGLATVKSVSAGGMHMLAYGEPLPQVSRVAPASGAAAGGRP